MALTDQPYLPLYVDDYLSDEKLSQCDACSEGIYIRIICFLHKSESYGSIKITPIDKAKLKQKASKTASKIEAKPEQKELIEFLGFEIVEFALIVEKVHALVRRDVEVVTTAIIDLIANDVIQFSDNVLSQKRMVKDGQKSEQRAIAGAKSKQKKSKPLAKPLAKQEQIPVNVNGIVNESVNNIEVETEKKETTSKKIDPQKVIDLYNGICRQLPKAQELTKARKTTITARLKVHGLAKITEVFQIASHSDFLNGNNKENWNASFDWLMKPTNFIKTLEGNYQNKNNAKSNPNTEQRINRQTAATIQSNSQGWHSS